MCDINYNVASQKSHKR